MSGPAGRLAAGRLALVVGLLLPLGGFAQEPAASSTAPSTAAPADPGARVGTPGPTGHDDPELAAFATRLDPLVARLERLAGDTGAAGVLAVGLADRPVRIAAFGRFSAQADTPMAEDALFALDTLTQPFVAAAALMLQERGGWLLEDRLADHVPAFSHSDIRLVDLLLQSAGLPADLAGNARWRNPEAPTFDHGLGVARNLSGESFVRLLARAKPEYAPGQITRPGFDYDLLGLALSASSGQPLGTWLLGELFVPLELWDLGFHLDGDRVKRFVAPPHERAGDERAWREPQDVLGFDCGSACLVGTAADTLRFAQWLLVGGALGERRLLSRESIELMTRDQLRGRVENRIGLPGLPASVGGSRAGYGFGVGTVGPQGLPTLPGNYGAYGVSSPLGHLLWVDPASSLVVVLLARTPDAATAGRAARLTQAMVYGARP